ncbi:sugar kinase [Pseudothermotoga thermarum]|uniref:PfkB domain protein n=1 Tax=Pseudothermotoga thermarum DSM 5069 TaxID=688269 RepID=F7YTH2_9THEM|nr:sugar kinase [Pseudothermotoga thermarum]AEH51186.1 PfkB domain protein [Pseudothermotoga thermarum DSM 5069]
MSKVVTFGEIMMRLATPGYVRFVQANSFEVSYAGAEANVAVSLASFGVPAAFVTKLPNNEFGLAVLRTLRQYGVDTSFIKFAEGRLGIYFLETGFSQRPSKVIYDRANSVFALSKPEDYDWDKIFENASWFHFTGITPALSDNLAQACLQAVQKAKEKGLTVSCDLNYRAKLWSPQKANQVMSQLVKYVDILFANEEDAEKVFGIKADESNVQEGKLSLKGYEQVARRLREQFGFKMVAITLRESITANVNGWSGVLLVNDEFLVSKHYTIYIVDRVGAGDSFAAGLIYGLINNMKPQEALEFAVAASCLKHTIIGDFNQVSVDEVLSLMKGGGAGRVQR